MKVEIVTATDDDAHEIMQRELRGLSVQELEIIKPDPTSFAINMVHRGAYCWTGRVDGRIVAMWGVERPSMLSGAAYLWFVSTVEADKYPFMIARRSKMFIEEILRQDSFRLIHGVVAEDYPRSIRWLRWLGFTVFPPKDGFRAFEMRKR